MKYRLGILLFLALWTIGHTLDKRHDNLINLNKRSAMLLDRLMYNLKEIMRKIPKDQIENGGGNSKNDATSSLDVGSDSRMRFDRRGYRYIRRGGKVYTKCYMNAVSCF